MSPRTNPSSSSGPAHRSAASTPYTRRTVGQPKSSRQQFSACGACRMRRVKCDLKDLPFDGTSPPPACSNCRERGLKCVDEFADVKAVKLLRRGRRLQQVEAVYGKVVEDNVRSSPEASSSSRRSSIPQLHPDFFSSNFWLSFSVQRPVLDPADFPTRYFAHASGQSVLGAEGLLIASLLVIWAYSFGVDERGDETVENQSPMQDGALKRDRSYEQLNPRRLETLSGMLKEILELIDFHGIMRLPTWDGVRALLLAAPLMDDVQHPVDRLAMNQTILVQIDALSGLSSPRPSGPSSIYSGGPDALARARVVWYAYVHEGITTGLHGGRLILDDADLDSLEFPISYFGNMVSEGPSGLPSPISPAPRLLPSTSQLSSAQHHVHPEQIQVNTGSQSPSQELFQAHHLFTIPVQLSGICRKIHEVLTGPKAKRRISAGGFVDESGVRDIWEGLERCWDQFESLRQGVSEDWEAERFITGWKIFIFECYNIVRESLKEILVQQSPSARHGSPPMIFQTSASSVCSSSSTQTHALTPAQLYASATRKCRRLLPHVVAMIKFHLLTPDQSGNAAGLFRWDTGFVRDGCFFAGFLAAGSEAGRSSELKTEDGAVSFIDEESVAVCLRALDEMHWECSKSEDRAQTIRMILEAHRLRMRHQDSQSSPSTPLFDQSFAEQQGVAPKAAQLPLTTRQRMTIVSDRSEPSSVAVSPHPVAPNSPTSSWPLYTPPATAATSKPADASVFQDSQLAESHSYKADDIFYRSAVEVDPFNYDAPGLQGTSHDFVDFQQRPHQSLQPISSGHLTPSVFPGSSTIPLAHGGPSSSGHHQFTEDCPTFYLSSGH